MKGTAMDERRRGVESTPGRAPWHGRARACRCRRWLPMDVNLTARLAAVTARKED